MVFFFHWDLIYKICLPSGRLVFRCLPEKKKSSLSFLSSGYEYFTFLMGNRLIPDFLMKQTTFKWKGQNSLTLMAQFRSESLLCGSQTRAGPVMNAQGQCQSVPLCDPDLMQIQISQLEEYYEPVGWGSAERWSISCQAWSPGSNPLNEREKAYCKQGKKKKKKDSGLIIQVDISADLAL